MHEFYLKEGKLIQKQEWEQKIIGLKSKTIEELDNHAKAKEAVAEKIISAVEKRVPKGEPFGVLFSGGVDSSLIALILKKAKKDFVCYTLGFKNEDTKDPEDVEAAKKAAEKIGVNLKVIMVDVKQAEDLIKKTVNILGKELANVVNVGVAAVEVGCIEEAKKDGIRYLFGGLGSEELFAGYDRHKKAIDKQAECWNGLLGMYERDLLRDSTVAKVMDINFMTPFLDEELLSVAMRVPARYKMTEQHAKLILREVAEDTGLPKEVAWREKRAAQYGSRIDKAIDKIARQKGFELKKEYLKSLN